MKLFPLMLLMLSASVFSQIPSYYNDVNLSLNGNELKDELAIKIITTHTNTLSYANIYNAIKITDVNPSDNTELLLMYGYENGTDAEPKNDRERALDATCGVGSCEGLWNREHVFANSLGNPRLEDSGSSGIYSDAHNLRPADANTNSTRGNKLFAIGTGNSSAVDNGWYPGDEWKGDVARIAMYMYLRYGNQCLPTYLGVGSSASTPDDMIDLFLQWNVEDPVSEIEKQRNTYHDSEEVYAQGNRNPFIDNPAFATKIWGGDQAQDLFSTFYDIQAPSVPNTLITLNISGNTFSLSWNESTDNVLVTGYNILIDDIIIGTSTTNSYNILGLIAASIYNVKVQAYDASGNTSDASLPLIVHTSADEGTNSSDLFFSEYIEGSSNNKALEIANYTGENVDLSIYSLKKQTNGAGAWSSALNLTGTLTNGDVFVLNNSSASSVIIDESDMPGGSKATFNGNDPVGLFKNDILIDIIGVFDGGAGYFAQNITLQRKPTILGPNTNFSISEWNQYPTDTFFGLGSHILTGTNTFLAIVDNDWDTPGNWSFGTVPNNTNAIIRSGESVIASENIYVDNLTLESNSSLSVTTNVTNSGTIILNSEASLIAQNSTNFDLTYQRYLETTNLYLVSSAVTNETLEDIIDVNTFAQGTESNIGLSDYVNTTSSWTYANTETTGTLLSGEGRSVKLASAGNITVTGEMPTDSKNIFISDGGASGKAFNLIGNPFPSYLAVNHTSPSGANNLLSANSSVLAEQTIWFWNQKEGGYKEINQASAIIDGIRYLSPSQGFFVKSNASGGDFTFPESLQSHQSTDVFSRKENNYTHIKLKLNNNQSNSSTDIIYMDGATFGWDNGLDATIFDGASNDFTIYSELVENNNGQDLGIQSLPNYDFSEIISIGVNALADTEITISAEIANLTDSYQTYLEDKVNDTFTLLDTYSKYTTTLTSDLKGTGRYYLHTTSTVLDIDDVAFNKVSIYSVENNTIQISGLDSVKTSLFLYDITGKQVFKTSFIGNTKNTIKHANLRKGIYIIQLQNSTGTINRKLILK